MDLDPEDPTDVRPVVDDCPDPAMRPDLDMRTVLDDLGDTSERSDLDDSSEMEDILVFEVISDSAEGTSVGLFSSGSSCAWTSITLMKNKQKNYYNVIKSHFILRSNPDISANLFSFVSRFYIYLVTFLKNGILAC